MLRETLMALGASGVLLSGLVVPLLTLQWATSSRAKAAITVFALLGYLVTSTMVVVWLARRSALGWGLFGSAPFLWAMAGFVLLAAFLALMLGTFATDAPRPRAQTLAAFWITFAATLLVFTGVGIPFAALVSRPAALWLRPLIAIGALFSIVMVISPLASLMSWIASRRRAESEEEPWR